MIINNTSKKITSSFFNRFVLHTIISGLPNLLTVSIIPIILKDYSIVFIGSIFFLYRIGNLFGFFVMKRVNNCQPSKLISAVELFNFFSTILLYCSLLLRPSFLIILPYYFFKGLSSAIQANTRSRWLKQIDEDCNKISKSVFIYCQGITQASFGLAGLLHLVVKDSSSIIFIIIAIDSISSLLAAILFSNLESDYLQDIDQFEFSRFSSKRLLPFLGIDFLIAMAMGGTNILVFEFGSKYLGNNGYQKALIFYSMMFLFATYLMNHVFKRKNIFPFSLVSLFISLCLSSLASISYGNFFFCFIMISYPLYLLSFEKLWFEIIPSSLAGIFFNNRMIVLIFLWALGEPLYSMIDNDLYIRALFSFIALTILVFTKFTSKYISD